MNIEETIKILEKEKAYMDSHGGDAQSEALCIAIKALERMTAKTNADRIRNMSDKELAEWLTKITNDAQSDAKTKCNYRWYEWLLKEVEE